MKKMLLLLAGSAVALTGAPAAAHMRHHARTMVCNRHGHCVRVHRVRAHNVRVHRYRVGYVFGPNYTYVPVTALPQPVVTRYSLTPDYRYVVNGPYVYVVDPTTYAVTRVLNSIVH